MTAVAARVRMLTDVTAAESDELGGKAANLGELVRAGLPVPPGFVLPASAYLDAMGRAGARDKLAELHREAVACPDVPADLQALSSRAEAMVRQAGIPADLREAVRAAYAVLPANDGWDAVVAVRSSAVGEDSADTSFAGMNVTFTNVRGIDTVLARIVDCWASVFEPCVVAYRAAQGSSIEPAIAVVIQVMVDAQRSSVAFTADPAIGRRDCVVVEAALGQGEVVASGAVEPDTYQLSARSARPAAVRIGHQTHQIVRGVRARTRSCSSTPSRPTREC